ncbi:MAG: hypothetical protein AB8H80_06685 [Planctomycetota bacterium]
MIRGPILPHLRERLWALVSRRLDSIESGLRLVLESLDCGGGEVGPLDGVARDAIGAPVLILLAVEGDALLSARALAAGQFLQRVGDSLAQALPEGNYSPGCTGRILVVGTDAAAKELAQLQTLPIHALEACTLEPFRVSGSERFAVRWLTSRTASGRGHGTVGADSLRSDALQSDAEASAGGGGGGSYDSSTARRHIGDSHANDIPGFAPPAGCVGLWHELESICRRMDPAVRIHGDRFVRRVFWNGHLLGEVQTLDEGLVASSGRSVGRAGAGRELRVVRDVRRFADEMLRALARHARMDFVLRSHDEHASVDRLGQPAGSVRMANEDHGANGNGAIGAIFGNGAGSASATSGGAANGSAANGSATNGRPSQGANSDSISARSVPASSPSRLPAVAENSFLGHDRNGDTSATRHAVGSARHSDQESLRESLAASELTPEEHSALGDPASVAGAKSKGSVAKDRS